METIHIAVLDFNNYEVTLYKAELKDGQSSKTIAETIEQYLSEQGHNLDEINYMYGNESIAINNLTGYKD